MNTRLALMFVLIIVLFVAISCLAAPANAQSVTPLPGPQATATAAAQQMSAAQSQRQQAEQLQAQADAARTQAEAAYQQAAQNAATAQAAMAAQQAAAAGEAIGRAQANIENGNQQLQALSSVTAKQSDIIEAQAAQIISATNEAQQLRMSLQTTNAAYTAQQAQIEADKGKGDIGSYAALFAFVMCAILIVALIAVVLQRRNEPTAQADPPIDAPWKVTPQDDDRAEDDPISQD